MTEKIEVVPGGIWNEFIAEHGLEKEWKDFVGPGITATVSGYYKTDVQRFINHVYIPNIIDAFGRQASESEIKAKKIWDDLDDRRGFDMRGLDHDVQKEIFTKWVGILDGIQGGISEKL